MRIGGSRGSSSLDPHQSIGEDERKTPLCKRVGKKENNPFSRVKRIKWRKESELASIK